jgi:two-component system, NtrC family, nitrogen regulation sensor histidine kinase NtrY
MTIQKKYVLFFSGFVFLIAFLLSAVSIGFLKETYDRILHAANASYLPVMASHMFFRAVVTFAIVSGAVVAVSIPLGIFLSQQLSAPYLRIFRNLRDIAQKRMSIDDQLVGGVDEKSLLENYIGILVEDLQTVKEYEKGKSWKDGARMLMHELKNPLTPLKLSAQQLSLDQDIHGTAAEEVRRILLSIGDIEQILFMFKELVNLEFGKKTAVDIREFVDSLKSQLRDSELSCPLRAELTPGPLFVQTETTLLRMLAVNLIRNGIEENTAGFFVEISEDTSKIHMAFCTQGAHIAESNRLFRPGYSSKGVNRGFGLFLCKMISDYLDLNLSFHNTTDGVRFSITLEKSSERLPAIS